jgi:hypothetical protein
MAGLLVLALRADVEGQRALGEEPGRLFRRGVMERAGRATIHSSAPLPIPPHVGGGDYCGHTAATAPCTQLAPILPHVGGRDYSGHGRGDRVL